MRGSIFGSALGLLPGGGAVLSSFISYSVEKKVSRNSAEFGQGAIEGVAGPEAANNAGAQTSFIPMLTLGIPANAVMAIMLGALMIHGIAPGPKLIENQPTLFWGLVASMFIANLMLLVLNLPLVSIWVRLLSVPYRLLFPCILVFACVGVFGESNQSQSLLIAAAFGGLGYILMKLNCQPAPLLLGFVLGPMMEENFRRSLVLSRGSLSVFIDRPISLMLLLTTAAVLVLMAAPSLRKARQKAFAEENA
jgi:putative tricarboxylic transport membrane protein